jgi:hypothetical protein
VSAAAEKHEKTIEAWRKHFGECLAIGLAGSSRTAARSALRERTEPAPPGPA